MVFNQLCNKCKTTRKFISAKKVSEPNRKATKLRADFCPSATFVAAIQNQTPVGICKP